MWTTTCSMSNTLTGSDLVTCHWQFDIDMWHDDVKWHVTCHRITLLWSLLAHVDVSDMYMSMSKVTKARWFWHVPCQLHDMFWHVNLLFWQGQKHVKTCRCQIDMWHVDVRWFLEQSSSDIDMWTVLQHVQVDGYPGIPGDGDPQPEFIHEFQFPHDTLRCAMSSRNP